MSQTLYTPLDPGSQQIRLLTILPTSGKPSPPKWSPAGLHDVSSAVYAAQSNESKEGFAQRLQENTERCWQTIKETLEKMNYNLYGSSNIECTMETVSLLDRPPFVALSYTWGDPTLNKTIQVNGQTFNITTSLSDALGYLRRSEESVTLWADAICINQQDLAEKREQVPLMRLIYERAITVIAWLGHAADDSDKVMAAFNDIGKQAIEAGILNTHGKEFQKIFHGLGGMDLNPEQQAIKDSCNALSDKVGLDFPFRAFGHFASRRYWQRVWIIQEVSVAREVTVMCGVEQTRFSNIAATVIFNGIHVTRAFPKFEITDYLDPVKGAVLKDMINSSTGEIPKLIGHRRNYQLETASRPTFFKILTRSCLNNDLHGVQRASNLRDILYGVLAMASDCKKLQLIADYSKEIEDVYMDATKRLLGLGFMNILAWSQQAPSIQRRPGLPSWVPDYSNPIRAPCNGGEYFDIFYASGKHRYVSKASPIQSSQGPTILALTCFRVDTIDALGLAWQGELPLNFTACRAYFDSIESLCWTAQTKRTAAPGCVVVADWKEAIWRIPSGDKEIAGSHTRGTEAMHRDFKAVRAYLKTIVPGDDNKDYVEMRNTFARYIMALERQHNRKPFVSSMGYVGLVPAQSRKGDVVCIVEGANMPFVFRRDGKLYRLVGEAYVYGIMDGEFMESNPLMEVFHVC